MKIKRENFLYIAIAIPIVMLVIAIINVSFFLATPIPAYNFLYAKIDSSDNQIVFLKCVELLKNKLQSDTVSTTTNLADQYSKLDCSGVDLYLYDVKNNVSSKMTLEQGQHYQLSKTNQAPDKFTVQQYCYFRGNYYFPDMNLKNSYFVCLKKGDYQQKLSIPTDLYASNFAFLGWILSKK